MYFGLFLITNFFCPVSAEIGCGYGTFMNFQAGEFPESAATGDFNADGYLDVAVANSGSNDVSILIGIGDGTFQKIGDDAVLGSPRSIAVGDFNKDSHLDLVTANFSSDNISVLLGNGDGTFLPATTLRANL